MNIAATTSVSPSMPIAQVPESKEIPGRDHDGDSDDKSITPSAGLAATPAGMGSTVNTTA